MAIVAGEHHGSATIIGLGEAQAAVARRNFDAEGAHLSEAVDDLPREFTGAINFVRVHMLAEEGSQFLQKDITRSTVFDALFRKWEEAVQREPTHEQFAAEAATFGGGFARGLG